MKTLRITMNIRLTSPHILGGIRIHRRTQKITARYPRDLTISLPACLNLPSFGGPGPEYFEEESQDDEERAAAEKPADTYLYLSIFRIF